MKLSHWQYKAATRQLDRECPKAIMAKDFYAERVGYCPFCGWDAVVDYPIKFEVEG